MNRISRKGRKKRMQWTPKEKGERQRHSCSQNSHFDRLPDDILVHILSFMSTKDCVRSSTLGKRWRFLWDRVPNLEFNSGDHKTLTSFSNFFNRFVFEHKGQNINTFRIAYEDDEDVDDMDDTECKYEIETLIATAIACDVKVIDIQTDFEFLLPQCLFTCKTLVDLTLNCICDEGESIHMVPIMTDISVYLPALKKLELRMVRYESEESLVHLISGCPALEDLTILKESDDVVCLNISSLTLTRLDLEIASNCNSSDEDYEVKLDTPKLKYLRLHISLSGELSAGTLASLTEADVFFHDPLSLDVHYPVSVLEFVGKLNHVSCLKLTIGWLEVPNSVLISALTTEFHNLTRLEFVGEWDGDWRFVKYFLENSDNLEVLIINMVKEFQYWMEPKQVPVCLIYQLRKVRFDDFACFETEFNMVEYILRNAKVLKRMEICLSKSQDDSEKKKNSEACKRISLFERASKACLLVFFI